LFTALIQGFIVLIITGTVYGYTLAIGWEEAAARTITFSTLIFANLLLVLANRSWTLNFFQSMAKHNKALWPIISACFVFLFLAIYLPYAQDVFGFSKLSIKSIGISFGVALISIVMFEVMKFSQRQKLT
jgi:Ca2+-transporting ATPase